MSQSLEDSYIIRRRPKVATINGGVPVPSSASEAIIRPTLPGLKLRRMTMIPPARRTGQKGQHSAV